MADFPALLIQIHYHDRAGGVRQVVDRYSSFFRRRAGDAAGNYLICASSRRQQVGNMTVIDLPAADYHRFTSAAAFERRAEALTRSLVRLVATLSNGLPVAVIGHNLALGKNLALSAAFTRCAETLGGSAQFRFYSVLHDIPYDGRKPLFPFDGRAGAGYSNPDDWLFSAGAPVHFIVPSAVTAQLSGLGKREISVLPNPLAGPNTGALRTPAAADTVTADGIASVKRMLGRYARKNGFFYNASQPLYCYPSRMIYRKNVFEAMLLVNLLLDGTLVTGGCGTLAVNRQRMKTALALSARYGWSFMPFTPGIGRAGDIPANPFVPLLQVAEAGVSTSVSEGFGYALFEPWQLGKEVIGRMPSGTTMPEGMELPGTYSRLPVPVEWISVAATWRKLSCAYQASFQKKYQSLQRFSAEVIIDEAIDFAILSSDQQVNILKRIAECDRDRERLLRQLAALDHGWPGLAALRKRHRGTIVTNRKMLSAWAQYGFAERFEHCLMQIPCKPENRRWYSGMRRYFEAPARFRPFF